MYILLLKGDGIQLYTSNAGRFALVTSTPTCCRHDVASVCGQWCLNWQQLHSLFCLFGCWCVSVSRDYVKRQNMSTSKSDIWYQNLFFFIILNDFLKTEIVKLISMNYNPRRKHILGLSGGICACWMVGKLHRHITLHCTMGKRFTLSASVCRMFVITRADLSSCFRCAKSFHLLSPSGSACGS